MFEFETPFNNSNRHHCIFIFYDDGTYTFKNSNSTYNRIWALTEGELWWKSEFEDNFIRWSGPDKCTEITHLIMSYYAEKELLGE